MNPRPLSDLEAVAQGWVGTPFMANSCVKGAGVSCHLLPFGIYRELDWLPVDLAVPQGSPAQARWRNHDEVMRPWLDHCPYFQRSTSLIIQPGDLLGYKVRDIVHHLAIALEGERLIESLQFVGTRIWLQADPSHSARLAGVWNPTRRPLIPSASGLK